MNNVITKCAALALMGLLTINCSLEVSSYPVERSSLKNNIRQRSKSYLDTHYNLSNINDYDIELETEIDIIFDDLNGRMNTYQQDYIDSYEIEEIVNNRISNLINTIENVVYEHQIDAVITQEVEALAAQKGLLVRDIPYTMNYEYNAKRNEIRNNLERSMRLNRSNNVRKQDVVHEVFAKLDYFFDRAKSRINASQHTWHPTPAPQPTTSWHTTQQGIALYELEQKTIDIAYNMLGVNPDTLPARVVSDFSDAIQRILRTLRGMSRVTANDIKRIARPELQRICDNMNYKDESCSICLDEYHGGDRVGILSCEHIFHKDCIYSWLNRQKTCPLCRKNNVIVAKMKDVPYSSQLRN